MDNCNDTRETLLASVFGEADDEAEVRMNQHLLSCASCRAEEKSLLVMRDTLHGGAVRESEVEASAALRERVRTAVSRRRAARDLGDLDDAVSGFDAPRSGARRARGALGFLFRPVPVYAMAAASVVVGGVVYGLFGGVSESATGDRRDAHPTSANEVVLTDAGIGNPGRRDAGPLFAVADAHETDVAGSELREWERRGFDDRRPEGRDSL